MQIPSKDYNFPGAERSKRLFLVCDDDDSTLVAKTPTSFVCEQLARTSDEEMNNIIDSADFSEFFF